MGLSNGKLTKPFSIAEIAKCLGESSGDAGTLCCSTKTNPWSKHKPVRSSSKETTEEVFACADGNYGLNIAGLFVSTTGANIVSNIQSEYTTDGSNGWAYLRPRRLQPIGVDEQYRMFDFDGYNHNAQSEFTMSNYLSVGEGAALTVTPFKRDFLNDDSILRIKDLQSIHTYDGSKQFYFGAFVTNGSTLVDIAVSDTPITEGISGVTLSKVAGLSATGNTTSPYKVYCFLGSAPGDYDYLYSREMTVIPFPLRVATLQILQQVDPIVITPTALQNSSFDSVVAFNIKIVNNNAGNLSLTNNYIRYYPTGSGTYTQFDLDDVEVSTGQTKLITITGTDLTVKAASRWSYSLGGGKYTASGLGVTMSIDGDITIQSIG